MKRTMCLEGAKRVCRARLGCEVVAVKRKWCVFFYFLFLSYLGGKRVFCLRYGIQRPSVPRLSPHWQSLILFDHWEPAPEVTTVVIVRKQWRGKGGGRAKGGIPAVDKELMGVRIPIEGNQLKCRS